MIEAQDLALAVNPDLQAADLVLGVGGFETDGSLVQAVLLSLLTDRRLPDDMELPEGEADRRGWCLDFLGGDDEYGSHWWTLRRAKRVPATLQRLKVLGEEALDWMVQDGVIRAATLVPEWSGLVSARIPVYIDEASTPLVTVPFSLRQTETS